MFQLVVACASLFHLFVVAVVCLLFYVVFVGHGAVLAFGLCVCLSAAASFVPFPRETFKIAFILVGTTAIFVAVSVWVLNNSPGGTYTSQAGSVVTTWWQDGAYTPAGTARVWRVVGAGMLVFLVSEAVRSILGYVCANKR